MNKFWLKIGIFAAIVVGLIVLVSVFSSYESEPKPKPKTVYDIWEEDDKRLRAELEGEDEQLKAERRRDRRTRKGRRQRNRLTKETEQRSEVKQTDRQQQGKVSAEDELQAQRLFEMALFHRKAGRLPVMSFKKMVDYCREIITKYPNSSYAPKARRMLRDIPQRFRKQYNITDEEMGLSDN